jgi:hypothetical protein
MDLVRQRKEVSRRALRVILTVACWMVIIVSGMHALQNTRDDRIRTTGVSTVAIVEKVDVDHPLVSRTTRYPVLLSFRDEAQALQHATVIVPSFVASRLTGGEAVPIHYDPRSPDDIVTPWPVSSPPGGDVIFPFVTAILFLVLWILAMVCLCKKMS